MSKNIIKKYNEFINEIYNRYFHKDVNNKYFMLYKKDLFIFSDLEWETKKIYLEINNLYGKEIANNNFYHSYYYIASNVLDILVGYIENNTIYLEYTDTRHSSYSPDIIKIKHFFSDYNYPVKIKYHEEDEINVEQEENIYYHGTCKDFLDNIMKYGLRPNNVSNYKEDDIIHTDKVFITSNIEKSYLHAIHTAEINDSEPIVIKLKIPDKNLLVVDYDLYNIVYNDDNYKKELKYDIKNTNIKNEMDYKKNKNITNKIGIFGYKGRIPSSYFISILEGDKDEPLKNWKNIK